jgi:3-mercaptopyruvate sulfurtransferase SseA
MPLSKVLAAIGAVFILASGTGSAATPPVPWPESAVVPPKALVRQIQAKDGPFVLQVSYDDLYRDGHVPGSRHAGPGETKAGQAMIRKLVKDLPRDREIVIYCGCCPYKECANLLPVYGMMRKMGFRKLRVLQLDNDFAIDWMRRGLPLEKGPGPGAGKR